MQFFPVVVFDLVRVLRIVIALYNLSAVCTLAVVLCAVVWDFIVVKIRSLLILSVYLLDIIVPGIEFPIGKACMAY